MHPLIYSIGLRMIGGGRQMANTLQSQIVLENRGVKRRSTIRDDFGWSPKLHHKLKDELGDVARTTVWNCLRHQEASGVTGGRDDVRVSGV